MWQSGHIKNLIFQGNGHQRVAKAPQRVAGTSIARILAKDTIAGAQKHIRQQRQSLLRTIGDHNLIGMATHATRRSEVVRNGRPQRQVALSAVITAKPPPAFLMVQHAVPGVDGKGVQIRQAGLKWQAGIFRSAGSPTHPVWQ